MRTVVLMAGLVGLMGCVASRRAERGDAADRDLTAKGRNVRLRKADPPMECVDLGQVSSSVSGLASQENVEEAKVLARNEAGARGADYLRLESMRFNAVAGTAFSCGLPMVAGGPTKSITGPTEDYEKVLTAQGKQVRVMKSDPPFACLELGQVAAAVSGFVSQENENEAVVVARNRSATLGADYFRLDAKRPNGVMGTAFRCAPPEKTTAAATTM